MPDWSASTGPWLPPNGASWRSRRSLDGSRTWRASCAPPGGSTPRGPEENVDDRVLSPALRHRGRAERCGRRGPPNGLEAFNESKWPGHQQWRGRAGGGGAGGGGAGAPRAPGAPCHSAWVDTFSFQAPGFYPKLGYEVFGELDYPPGHRRIFFRKHLEAKAGAQVYASE